MDKPDIAAILISSMALIFTAWQACLQRRHNKLSVKPHLQFNEEQNWTDGGMELRFQIQNHGLGPAIIESVTYFLNGVPCPISDNEDFESLLNKTYGNRFKIRLKTRSHPSSNYAIKASDSYLLASVFFDGVKVSDNRTADGLRIASFGLSVKYCSIYGDVEHCQLPTSEIRTRRQLQF